jgi:hypothetical protein
MKFLTIAIFLLVIWGKVLAQDAVKPTATIPEETALNEAKNSYDQLKIQQDLLTSLAQTNLGYLTISVAILGVLGGVFYVFNLKPIQDKISKQEQNLIKTDKESKDNITKIEKVMLVNIEKNKQDALNQIDLGRDEIQSKSEALMLKVKDELNNEIKTARLSVGKLEDSVNKKLTTLEHLSQRIELSGLWNEHYMWDGRKIYSNTLQSLITYLEKGIEYKIDLLFSLCLGAIDDTLEKLTKGDIQEQEEDLQKVLSQVKSNVTIVNRIQETLKRKLK